MCARTRRDNGNEISASISVTVNKDGTIKTFSPTPPINDNSTQIATTNWVMDKLNKLNTEVSKLNNELNEYKTNSVLKTDLIKYITPNYKNGVTSQDLNYKSGDEIIMEKSGVIICYFIGEDYGARITINGTTIYSINHTGHYHDHILVPIKKGDRFIFNCQGNPGDPTNWRMRHFIIFYYEQQ
jgi:hypothetical protein